jgi:hypothetical protein
MRKNMLGLIGIALALGGNMPDPNPDTSKDYRDLPTDEERKKIEAANLEKYRKDKGLKPFYFGDENTEVWARNRKNAERKYKNLKNK